MPEDYFENRDTDELIAAVSDRIDAMSEEEFDPSALDMFLDALDVRAGGASEWDAGRGERLFREKHPELFEARHGQKEGPALEVLPGKKRHPRGRRLIGRVVAVAAVVALGAMLACQALGIDVFGFLGKWGREQFWFPGTEENQPQGLGVREGEYASLSAALKANGILTPMAPAWLPEEGEGFGTLIGTVQASKEVQSALFTADYRDQDGRGYTLEIVRYDFGGSFMPRGLGQPGAQEYVCDGTVYYIGKGNGGVTRIDWTREYLSGVLEGDLDVEAARRIVESVTRPDGERVYIAPDPDPAREPYGNDLQSMLEVSRLSPGLAPAWLPEGFEKSEIYEASSFGSDVTVVHASYDDQEGERELAIQMTWWEDPAVPVPPVFAGDWTEERVYEHNGLPFRILTDGDTRLVTWLEGHVSGWIWGDITQEEALKMVDSIPGWPEERPERNEPGITILERDVKEYDSPAAALEDRGLDAGLAPGWLPDGFVPDGVEGEKDSFGVRVYAAWMRGEELLSYHVTKEDESVGSSGTTVYEKDDGPVVEYVHNGVTYFIMTNSGRRTVAWKDGPLEGSISGPLSLEEAKQMVDSINYTAAEE